MSIRRYTKAEDAAYQVLTRAFNEGELVNERHGFTGHVAVDWATVEVRGCPIRVGMYRAGERPMGLLVELDETDTPFWVRDSYGDVAKLADGEFDGPIAIKPTLREKRAFKAVIRNLTRSQLQ